MDGHGYRWSWTFFLADALRVHIPPPPQLSFRSWLTTYMYRDFFDASVTVLGIYNLAFDASSFLFPAYKV